MSRTADSLKSNRFNQEFWVLVLISLSLLVSCTIISSRKPFWNDELYSWYFLADHSFFHMLTAFGDKINNTPVLYFALGWLWAKLFGASELSLRLFSSLGFCLSCIVVWITLRRTYGFWSSTIGVLAVFCTSEIILSQNAEARMYGLFIAICSFALLLYDTIGRHERIPKYLLILNSIVHAGIVHTHLFGLFYSLGIFLSFLARDIYFASWKFTKEKFKLYLSFAIAWLSFIFYIPAFLVQSDAGMPHSWIPKPILQDLILLLNLTSASFMKLTILALIFLVAGLQFLAFKKSDFLDEQAEQVNQNQQRSLLILAYIFLAIPVFVWLISIWKRPIFYDRYLIPSVLSWVILVTHISEKILPTPKHGLAQFRIQSLFSRKSVQFLLPLTLTLILLSQPLIYAKNYRGKYTPGSGDNTFGYGYLPIVLQASSNFLERRFYSPHKGRYFFVLDWEAAKDEASGLFGSQEYKHMDAFKRNYPNLFEGHILTSNDFLEKYQEFLVLDYEDYTRQCSYNVQGGMEKARVWDGIHCPQWVEKRLLSNPNYQVTKLGEIYNQAILLVKKKI